MAYRMYLGDMLCPITPSKIDTKIKGQNKTLTLINDEEINVLKSAGLTEISFDLLLPNFKYRFAKYENNKFENAEWFLSKIEQLKISKKPFYYKINRWKPNGRSLYDTKMYVSLEDYTIKEDVKQGFDVIVSIKLKQYRFYGTKIVNVTFNKATTQETRPISKNAPSENTSNVKTYTVERGDTLWNIAKAFYGDGSKYTKIHYANIDIIGNNPSLLRPGQVLTIPDPTQDVPVPKTTDTSSAKSPSASASLTEAEKARKPQRKVKFTIKGEGYLAYANITYLKDGEKQTYTTYTGESSTHGDIDEAFDLFVDNESTLEIDVVYHHENPPPFVDHNIGTHTSGVTFEDLGTSSERKKGTRKYYKHHREKTIIKKDINSPIYISWRKTD